MMTSTTKVYFEVYNFAAMAKYCAKNGIEIPEVYDRSGKYDYFTSDYATWEVLYRNLPYSILGCYPC